MSEAGKRTGGEWGLSGGGHCISAYLPGTSETDRASGQHYYVPLLKTEYAPWQKSSEWLISEEDYKATAAFVIEAVNSHASLKARVEELDDLARNVGGFDDHLLVSADLNLLRSTLREFRDQARAILNRGAS